MIKKIFLIINSLFILYFSKINTFAQDKGLWEGVNCDLRKGDCDLDDFSSGIKGMIDIFLGLTGTVSVIFVIIGAYYLLFGSLKGDHTKGRETIVMALTGFTISVLAWFIVRFIFDNFG